MGNFSQKEIWKSKMKIEWKANTGVATYAGASD